MNALRLLLRWLVHQAGNLGLAVRRAVLRGRIAQLEQLLTAMDTTAPNHTLHRALYETRLVELRCELYSLDVRP